MSELRQKIYSKKRIRMANVISGMVTGGFTGYFVTNASSVLTIVCFGAAFGLLLHLSIVPKYWRYRFRKVFKDHSFKAFLGSLLLITVFSSCSVKHVKEPPQETNAATDKRVSPKEDFIPGFHPFKDDPDNLSPHNPLVKKFGDIPEVRTYIRLQQKFRSGPGLNIDEAIALYTAEVFLYGTPEAKRSLKQFKNDKARYQRQGIPMGGIVMRLNIKTDPSDKKVAATEAEN